jgi:O-antigen ligase
MEVSGQTTSQIDRRTSLLVAAFILALAVWRLGPVAPLQVALFIVGVLFLFGLKKPVFAMAAFLVSLLTVNNYIVAAPFGIEISLRVLLVLLTVVVVWLAFGLRGLELGPSAKRVIAVALVFVGISVIANLINTGWDWAFKDLRQTGTGLLIIILLPAVTNNLRDLKTLCGLALVVMAASAAVAVMQHYHILGMNARTLVSGYTNPDNRMPGMAEDPLDLAFVLAPALPVALFVYLNKGVRGKFRWLILAAAILMVLAMYFTYTRSAVIAVALGVAVLFPFLAKHLRVKVLLALLVVAFLVVLVGQAHQTRLVASEDVSAQSRIVLRQAGYDIIRDHPIWGIGAYKFPEVSVQYASRLDPNVMQIIGKDLGLLQPHNDFVYVGACYGIPALVAYLLILAIVLGTLLDSYRSTRRRFIKGFSAGLIGALAAYLVNAYYHNCFISMPLFWVLIGFSLAVAKLAMAEKKMRQGVQTQFES